MAAHDSARYTLGPYQLLAQIGQNRTSRLYVAQRAPDEPVAALRVITDRRATRPEFQQAFQDTLAEVMALEHPAIVPVLDAGVYYNVPCVITPYFNRGSLSGWLAQYAPLDAPHALVIAQQAAEALDTAHSYSIFHGDVRPGNLLIAQDGTIQVTGWGLGALLAESMEVGGRTIWMVGSPLFMAPEVLQTGQPTAAGDVYALGVMVYQMLAGDVPFRAERPLDTIGMHVRQPVPPLGEVRPDLPDEAIRAIEQALAKNPANRPGSAGELVAALADALNVAPENGSALILAAVARGHAPEARLLKGESKPKPRVPRRKKARRRTIRTIYDVMPAAWSKALRDAEFPTWMGGAVGAMAILLLIGTLLFIVGAGYNVVAGALAGPTATPGPAVYPTYVFPTLSPTPTLTPTETLTPTPTLTRTPTLTSTPSLTPTDTLTPLPTNTRDPNAIGAGVRTPLPPGWVPTRPFNMTYTPGALFTLGVILPQTPAPPPAPSGGSILFVRDGQIWAVQSDGWNLLQLTAQPGRQFHPTRNGSQIVFVSDRDGNMELYTVGNNGANPARLTFNGASDVDPMWSWGGDVIAFSSTRTGGGDIYTLRGGDPMPRLVNGNPAQDRWPSWSPGGQIVFASNREGGDFDLYIMNADGTGITALTANGADELMPVWSPDGGRIAYLSGGNVQVINADGSSAAQLTSSGGVTSVAWSIGGDQLVYSQNGDLMVISASGGAAVRITTGPYTDSDVSWVR